MKNSARNVQAFLREYECPCARKSNTDRQKAENCVDHVRLTLGDRVACQSILELRNRRFETSAHEDAPWFFSLLLPQRTIDAKSGKINIRFNIAGISVCAETLFVALGYSEKNRVRQKLVALVRRGETEYTHVKAGGRRGTKVSDGDLCRAWIRKMIGLHGEFIPAPRSTSGRGHVAIEARATKAWHRDYVDEVGVNGLDSTKGCVGLSRFREIWRVETVEWVAPADQVDRLGGMMWDVQIRSDRTRGIRICDTCANWNKMRKNASSQDEKMKAIQGKLAHLDDVKQTRATYGRNQLEARTSVSVGSAAVDATDMVKTRWPLVEYNGKKLEKLKQVKFKVTGFVDHILGYFIFITNP